MNTATRLFSLVVLVGCWAGCTHVKPYEREYLARPGMETSREAHQEAFVTHVRDSREGATTSGESNGGGCGCN